MKSSIGLKVLLYTDLAIKPNQLFWHRDLGLLTTAFRKLGHKAWLVVHPATKPTRNGPVIWASPSDVRNPSWWKSHKPDLVILGLWTRPKYDPIRRAALAATPRVMERADSDGMRTASCGLKEYARRRYDYCRDRTYRWPSLVSVPTSFFYSLASILATPWIEARLAQTLRLLPAVAVETPRATMLWKSLAAKISADPKRIHCIPHPIQTDIYKPNPYILKKNQIISVGRWNSYQKNLPLLLKTLTTFLDQNPAWNALVIGSGLPQTFWHPRIAFLSALLGPSLARKMQESKIFLSSSRFESFGLAGTEAAACSCVVVAPENILSHLKNLARFTPASNLLERLTRAAQTIDNPRQPFGLELVSSRYVAQAFLSLPVTDLESSTDSKGYGYCPIYESPSTPDSTTAKAS